MKDRCFMTLHLFSSFLFSHKFLNLKYFFSEIFLLPSQTCANNVSQVAGDDRSVLQTVLEADLERTHLIQKEKELHALMDGDKGTTADTAEYEYVQARLNEMEAWSAEARY